MRYRERRHKKFSKIFTLRSKGKSRVLLFDRRKRHKSNARDCEKCSNSKVKPLDSNQNLVKMLFKI